MLPQHLPLWIQAGRGRGQPDPFTLPLGQGPGLYMHASLSKGRPSRGSQHCWCPDPRGPSNGFSSKRGSKKEQPLHTHKFSLNFLASPRKVTLL